jgi:glycosyltransferase involved in cell wall biosynthesis
MRILIHSAFFHPSTGGIETFVDGLAGALARRVETVTVFAETPLGSAVELDRPYQIIRPGTIRRRDIVAECDVLLSKGPATRMLPIAWRLGIPFVLVHSGPIATCPIGIGWRNGAVCQYSFGKCLGCDVSNQSTLANVKAIARNKVLRWAMKRAKATIYISESIAKRVGHPGQVIGNFFDPTTFHANLEVNPEDAFLVVGRLVPIKGFDVVIRGFAIARRQGLRFRLRVVGDGPERANLERLAAQEGVADSVDFLGSRRGADLADQYRAAWALAVPTQVEEAFGIVMVEAMACGCTVIASDHGACPEVIADAGVLVPAREPAKWAEAMLALANDPVRRDWLSKRSIERATELFTLESVTVRYLEVLRSAVVKNIK